MGTHVIKMPDIGEGIAQVELVEWFVKVGDVITEDQVVADVMTDKATVEIPSPVSGTVMALGGQPGEVMAVGSELIRIEVEGSGNHVDAPDSKPAAVATAPAVSTAHTEAPAPVAPRPASPASLRRASPALKSCRSRPTKNHWPRLPCASARWMPVSNYVMCTAVARPGVFSTKTSTTS